MRKLARNLSSIFKLLFSIYLLSVLLFLLFYIFPFSPIAHLLTKMTQSLPSGALTPQAQSLLESQWGLNEPFFSRFRDFQSHLFLGDLGRSWWTGQGVTPLVLSRCLPSLTQGFLSFILFLVLAFLFSWGEILWSSSFRGKVLGFMSVILLCTPPFALAVWIREYFPAPGPFLLGLLVYLLSSLPYLTFVLTQKLREELRKSHVRTSLAQGNSLRRTLTHHLLKPSLTVVVSYLPAWWSFFWATSLVVEPLFQTPGIGLLTFEAYKNQDAPLLLGISFFLGTGRLCLGFLRDVFCTQFLKPLSVRGSH